MGKGGASTDDGGGSRRVLQDPFRLISLWRESAASRSARWQLLRLLPQISPGLSLIVLVSILCQAAMALAFIVLVASTVGEVPDAVRDGFDSPAGRRLLWLMASVGVLSLVQRVWAPWHQLAIGALARRVDLDLQRRVMAATLGPPGIGHLEDPAMLDLVRDAGGIGEARHSPGEAVIGTGTALMNRLWTTQSAVVVATWHWWLGAGLLAMSLLVRYRVARDSLRTATTMRGATPELRRSDYARDLALTPLAAKDLRAFGLGPWLLERFRSQWLTAMSGMWRERKEENAAAATWSIPWGLASGLGLVYVGLAGIDGDLSLTRVTLLAQAVINAGSVYIGPFDTQMAYGAAAVPAILTLEERIAPPALAFPVLSVPAAAPEHELRFEGVSFRYPGTEREILSGLNLTIPAGESLAIVGANGAGKTTMVKLLARLYEPSAGAITADGHNIAGFDPTEWQRRIAAIFQDFLRYQLPARANVGLGAVEHQDDLDAIIAAASAAGARPAIEALPLGWDTVLSREYTDGSDLSGGEWQRIALARALFAVDGGARILVLDEPTANLDVRAEAALFDQFLALTEGITTILISHRFSTVRKAARIVVLDQGRVVEEGTHADLVAADGSYARMYRLQASRFVDDATEGEAVLDGSALP